MVAFCLRRDPIRTSCKADGRTADNDTACEDESDKAFVKLFVSHSSLLFQFLQNFPFFRVFRTDSILPSPFFLVN
jgi:hypothetical protein